MTRSSETLASLAAALSVFQGQVEAATKNATNPHLKNKYADLPSIWEAIRAPLAANGLAVVQLPTPGEDGRLYLETRLMHSSGEWIAGTIAMPLSKNDPQGYGSALTYARRYGLAAVLGITQEDDDAEAATNRAPARPAPAKAPPAAPPPANKASQEQLSLIAVLMAEIKMTAEQGKAWLSTNCSGKTSRAQLTKDEASKFIEHLEQCKAISA